MWLTSSVLSTTSKQCFELTSSVLSATSKRCFELTSSVLSTTSKRCFELTSSVLSTTSKQCFEQPAASFLFTLWFSLNIIQKVAHQLPFLMLPQSNEYVLSWYSDSSRCHHIHQHARFLPLLNFQVLAVPKKSWHQLWENHAPHLAKTRCDVKHWQYLQEKESQLD